MRKVGIDISAELPEVLTVKPVQKLDVCVTMECEDTCPVFPSKRYLNWELDDPAGQGIGVVRPSRDKPSGERVP